LINNKLAQYEQPDASRAVSALEDLIKSSDNSSSLVSEGLEHEVKVDWIRMTADTLSQPSMI
jgi:hypothetical protein